MVLRIDGSLPGKLLVVLLLLATPAIAFLLIASTATADAGPLGWLGFVVVPLALLGAGIYVIARGVSGVVEPTKQDVNQLDCTTGRIERTTSTGPLETGPIRVRLVDVEAPKLQFAQLPQQLPAVLLVVDDTLQLQDVPL